MKGETPAEARRVGPRGQGSHARRGGRRGCTRVARRERSARRALQVLAVAEHLGNWLPLRIMAEQTVGNRCYLWVEVAREVTAAAAKDYVRGCPAYVARRFKVLG